MFIEYIRIFFIYPYMYVYTHCVININDLFYFIMYLLLSRIRSVAFRPIATRGRLSIILTLTPHSTLDCISHHPLH